MADRPLPLKPEMVRATTDGRKTQTRRVIKNMPESPGNEWYFDAYNGGPFWNWWHFDNRMNLHQIKCPYGKPGDLLYVREMWRPWLDDKGTDGHTRLIRYMADDAVMSVPESQTEWFEARSKNGWHNRPSIHMPKWAARIWLKVEDIRVQPVQEISEADAIAEGIEPAPIGIASKPYFKTLWDSINGKPRKGGEDISWKANPWVWVVDFSVVSTTGRKAVQS